MTQDERWITKYNEVRAFIEANHRNPSKYRDEEHLMLNFLKHNRKLLNRGDMKKSRQDLFNELLALVESNKHVNQYF